MTADVSHVSGWREDDPTVFEMRITGGLKGEFQLTNGYGPIKAPQIMKVVLRLINIFKAKELTSKLQVKYSNW